MREVFENMGPTAFNETVPLSPKKKLSICSEGVLQPSQREVLNSFKVADLLNNCVSLPQT